MKIETFVTGIIGTNTYVAYNETTKEAVLVDPAACTKKLMHFIEEEGLSMKAVLLTHGHFDHIMGIDGFRKVYDVPVYVGEKEAGLITDATGTSPISIRRAILFLRRSMYRTGRFFGLRDTISRCFSHLDIHRGESAIMLRRKGFCSVATHCSTIRLDGRILRAAVCQILCGASRISFCRCRMRRKSCRDIWMLRRSVKRRNTIHF